uniref:Uncharacterized protein n=1 Tax=Arundo donax TaxID=35708 RepID=A0A0A9FZR6_ARUDO
MRKMTTIWRMDSHLVRNTLAEKG